ncbi:hypothetical protein V1511DRAFT_83756 [Dipodascopsis uninucleata]
MFRLNAAGRSRLKTSLFSTTFLVAVFTVAAPTILPCPATRYPVGADSGDMKAMDRRTYLAKRREYLSRQQSKENTLSKD